LLSIPFVYNLISSLSSGFKEKKSSKHKVVIVLPPKNSPSWILTKISKQIANRIECETVFVHVDEPIPVATHYFFSHYMFYLRLLTFGSLVFLGKSFVFCTHLDASEHKVSDLTLVKILKQANGLIVTNQTFSRWFVEHGVCKTNIHVAIGAANEKLFVPHIRKSAGYVGLCSAFYKRKGPDMLLKLVKALPHREFLLLGRDWKKYSQYDDVVKQPNFTYVETEYENYAGWYAKMTVFLSTSWIEGGPVPLIEAMMANVFPVVSDTGFAPDVIEHGVNGFLFSQQTEHTEIVKLIELAFQQTTNVSETVQSYSWEKFSQAIANVIYNQHHH
jgi:glycosyltransferase involved in cell wall biosynthesis